MDLMIIITLILMFLALYIMVFWTVLLISRSRILKEDNIGIKHYPGITVLIPSYNGERTIRDTINSVLNVDYPKPIEIIVLANGCTDDTVKIAKKYPVKVVELSKPSKARAINKGIKLAKNEIIITLDDDSMPEKDAIMKLVQYFTDSSIAAVTAALKVHAPQTLVQKLQALEYMISIVLKKILANINCLYVVPGPLTAYRKSLFKDVGGFAEDNLTEDTEMGMRLLSKGYSVLNALDAKVYTKTPDKLIGLVKQRLRWYGGFIQNSIQHRELYFNVSKGDIGIFLPTVLLSVFVMIGGLGLGAYYGEKGAVRVVNLIRGFIAIGFDFSYIQALIADLLKMRFTLLYFDWLSLFFMAALAAISLFTIYYGHKITQDKRMSLLTYGLYLILYYQLMTLVWLGATVKWFSGNKDW